MTHEEATLVISQTDLIAASKAGDLEKVTALFEANPTLVEVLNALTPKTGEATPQRAAACGRQTAVLTCFLEKGVVPDLFMACALGQVDKVDAYLKVYPKEVDAKGAYGVPLMNHAGNPEMVELLLKHGADATLAIIQLAWSGRVDLLKVAHAHGGLLNAPKHGRQALHIAAARGHVEAVAWLLQNGAYLLARAKGAEWECKTPLALAIMNEHQPVIELIKKRLPPKPPAKPFVARQGGGMGGGFRGRR